MLPFSRHSAKDRADGPWRLSESAPREADVPTMVPRHNREPATRGGNLHNRDNLVPKLSPEVNCMDLSIVHKFHFFFPMFSQTN